MDGKIYYIDQQRYKQKKPGNKKILLFLFLIIIFLGFVGLFWLGNRSEVIFARYGEVVDGFSTRALIVRDEKVQPALRSGYVNLKFSEGERIGHGKKVLQLKNNDNSYSVYNSYPGIISFATDGLEGYLTPEILTKLSSDDFSRMVRNYKQLVDGDYLSKDQPAFRIINNNQLYLVIKTEIDEVRRYRINEVVFVRDSRLNTDLIEGKIINKTMSEESGLLTVKLNRFIKEWLNLRWIEIEFVKNIYRGVVIPREAIFTQPEGEGVFISFSDSNYEFKNIQIIDGDEDRVVVEGLEVGDKIIANPKSVNYGRGGK